jgi:DnaD/phage-associated family protein
MDTQVRLGKDSLGKDSLVGEELVTITALHTYEKYIGIVTPTVADGIDFYILQKNMQPDLVIRIIEYAAEQGKRSWQYINKALLGNLQDNILDIDSYNRHQAERAERQKDKPNGKSKFNNYDDTNHTEYSALEERLLDNMLNDTNFKK